MTVAQLITLLQKFPSDWTVYARDWDGDWDTVSEAEGVMKQERVWDGTHLVPKSINAIHLDTY